MPARRDEMRLGPEETAGPIADLQRRLDAVADLRTKEWFENYLKHVIHYRGVKTPLVARVVGEWRDEHGLERLPDKDQLGLARSLIEESLAEDKFAAEVPGAADGAGEAAGGGGGAFRGGRLL